MQLEPVEREVLRHLKEVSNPLVPMSSLIAHLEGEGAIGEIDRGELESFLRKHELFRVLDPPGIAAEPTAKDSFADLGLVAEPFVMLDTRVPASREVTAALVHQVDGMASALVTAAREARDNNNEDRLQKIEQMLKRIEGVREKLIAMA